MNRFIKLIVYLVSIISITVITSCSESTSPENYAKPTLASSKNIKWTLIEIEADGVRKDASVYEPLNFAFLDEHVWGFNNCNTLRFTYSVRNDTLLLIHGGITEIGCLNSNGFLFDHILNRPKITFFENTMILSQNDTNYIYQADYGKAVPYYALWEKTLRLTASNDTNFNFFERLGLYPEISFGKGRTFNLQWYNMPPQQQYFTNAFSGLIGVKDDDKIQFTRIHIQGGGSADWTVAMRITKAERFNYMNGSLRLLNHTENTYYEFSPIAE